MCYIVFTRSTTKCHKNKTEELGMKKLVRINAEKVNSKFGYILEEFCGAALIKIACDELQCLQESNCIILGSDLYEEI